MDPGEWGFGDLAYEGAERMTVGIKAPGCVAAEIWTNFVAWVRARVEIVIALLKSHAWCQTTFRGRYKSLLIYQEIQVVMTAFDSLSKLLSFFVQRQGILILRSFFVARQLKEHVVSLCNSSMQPDRVIHHKVGFPSNNERN